MIAKLKENIIVYGSTGTGKTEILKRIANIYKIPIVIEGVENEEQLAMSKNKKIDFVQGYYFTKPLREKELLEFLNSNKK